MEAGWRFQAVLTYLYLTSKELEKIVTRREFDCAPVRCSDQKLVACNLFNVFKYINSTSQVLCSDQTCRMQFDEGELQMLFIVQRHFALSFKYEEY